MGRNSRNDVQIETSSAAMSSAQTLCDPKALHLALARLGQRRLAPAMPGDGWRTEIAEDAEMANIEGELLEAERHKVEKLAADVPRDAAGFGAWFAQLREAGPGQFDPLFPWLAQEADYEQMRWFVQQEVAGEAGFDDLVALTQLRMPIRVKLEMARNYWDEMGRGKAVGMHGPMLGRLAVELNIDELPGERLVWEALSLGNLLVAMAYNRRYAFHAVGALGVIELTAPTRAVCVAEGLERLGVTGHASHYFRLHSTVDVQHALDWKNEVIEPLVAAHPEAAPYIAEGALIRLNAGARCFDRYRAQFGLGGPRAQLD
jgi:hypothetical protein